MKTIKPSLVVIATAVCFASFSSQNAQAEVVRGACMSPSLQELVSQDPCAAAAARGVIAKIVSELSEAGADWPDCIGFKSIRKSRRIAGAYTVNAGGRGWEVTVAIRASRCVATQVTEVSPPTNF